MIRPHPEPTPLTEPFWQEARARRLAIQHCSSCRQYQFYPRIHCIHCGAQSLEWEVVSGRGTIYSYTVSMRAPTPAFSVPYIVAIVELDEGPRMLSNVVDCEPAEITVGSLVQVDFLALDSEISLPVFRLA